MPGEGRALGLMKRRRFRSTPYVILGALSVEGAWTHPGVAGPERTTIERAGSDTG